MPTRDPFYFTRKETTERIQAAKDFLSSKERMAIKLSFPYSVTILPDRYDPRLDENLYSPPRLQYKWFDLLAQRVIASKSWSLDTFSKTDVTSFVKSLPSRKAPIGSVLDLIFYEWIRYDLRGATEDRLTKFACLWLGTWNHGPRIFWLTSDSITRSPANAILPRYIDLF